jgi:hypothetical protein
MKGDIVDIRRNVATKVWVLGQTFVLLGGITAMLRPFH